MVGIHVHISILWTWNGKTKTLRKNIPVAKKNPVMQTPTKQTKPKTNLINKNDIQHVILGLQI